MTTKMTAAALLVLILVTNLVLHVTCSTPVLINDPNLIHKVNSHPKASWTAKAHKQFDGKTLEHMKRELLGTFMRPNMDDDGDMGPFKKNNKANEVLAPSSSSFLPEFFDAREKWPKCIGKIRNQGKCGSCWAVSGAEVVGDRFCIATNGSIHFQFSPQYILSCDKENYGCKGGFQTSEWIFLANKGTTSEQCMPYTSGEGEVEACPARCANGTQIEHYRIDYSSIQIFSRRNLEGIQKDIMTYGSVQVGFTVYQDFFTYSSGVYRHLTGGIAGGHAVKYVGWGVDSESNLPYWIAANSWGEEWGLDGYFWILRGSNECDSEAQVYSGRPDL